MEVFFSQSTARTLCSSPDNRQIIVVAGYRPPALFRILQANLGRQFAIPFTSQGGER